MPFLARWDALALPVASVSKTVSKKRANFLRIDLRCKKSDQQLNQKLAAGAAEIVYTIGYTIGYTSPNNWIHSPGEIGYTAPKNWIHGPENWIRFAAELGTHVHPVERTFLRRSGRVAPQLRVKSHYTTATLRVPPQLRLARHATATSGECRYVPHMVSHAAYGGCRFTPQLHLVSVVTFLSHVW